MLSTILVTGAEGQLGRELIQVLKQSGYHVYGMRKSTLDITVEQQVDDLINSIHPNIIIHCAAYTNVDHAETEKDRAFLINGLGSRNIAVASERINSKLVYISTDYVFNGLSTTPYHEFSAPSPINIYGNSKLAGEILIRELHSRYFIVRTSWIFGSYGTNFVKKMLQLSETREEVQVVIDQIGSPTYTLDLSHILIKLIETEKFGTYHISNQGQCSWYEFAEEIFNQTNASTVLKQCFTEDSARPAKRPSYSVLDNMALRLNNFTTMPHWKDALSRFLQQQNKYL